jgi:MGT family glycosyltransferase
MLKILFANVPADGHFNPLTGMATHLKHQGHDVRWYTSKMFSEKLQKLSIHFYPFKRALEVNQFTINDVFPERKKLKAGVPTLKFDLKHFFVFRAPEYFEDIKEIYEDFQFDVLVCDCTFTAASLVHDKLNIPVVAVGIFPVMATSRDLPPYGMGLTPDYSFLGRTKQSLLRFVAKNLLFKESTTEYNKIVTSYGLKPYNDILFDIPVKRANVYLQSGAPGFEYKRSDLPSTIKFVGPLHAGTKKESRQYDWEHKLTKFKKIILISQGTFEPDPSKLITPTLLALKDSPYLLIVTTGGHNTASLRSQFVLENVVIEDFIDFNSIMPKTDVYVTNGGFGGSLLAIDHGLPMVAAGINEGKNEICARIGYLNIGINLNTEKPARENIKDAVERILKDDMYKNNVSKLRDEFRSYDTNALCEKYIIEAAMGNKS